MESIRIVDVVAEGTDVLVRYEVSPGLACYFSKTSMRVSYPYDCSGVPASLLVVPFVANILPIAWLVGAEIYVDELDASFSSCLSEIQDGYEKMYPGMNFHRGKIVCRLEVENHSQAEEISALFYSGGLDSVDTFIRHVQEHPDLVVVWGSDIKYDNSDGWDKLQKAIAPIAQRFGLDEVVVKSEFREMLNASALNLITGSALHGSWWYCVQHALGLLGHVAPLAFIKGYRRMYIASSFTDCSVPCASNPYTDNAVRFSDCRVYHDGFDCSRQRKVANVVDYCRQNNTTFPLHVCWESQSGGNCCSCEKCLRTIAGILAEGADPADFGFAGYDKDFRFREKWELIRRSLWSDRKVMGHARFWESTREKLIECGCPDVENVEVGRFLKRVRQYDFMRKPRKTVRMRGLEAKKLARKIIGL